MYTNEKPRPRVGGAALILVSMEDRPENDKDYFDANECSDGEHHHHNPAIDIQRRHPDCVCVWQGVFDCVCNPPAKPLCTTQHTWPVEARVDVVCNPKRESDHADSSELKHFFEHPGVPSD